MSYLSYNEESHYVHLIFLQQNIVQILILVEKLLVKL